ncbi:MAG: hypothetical protein J5746_13700, partial [Victivallales bacterium]|nr:hypothetical protein [Victivallales bacterium]
RDGSSDNMPLCDGEDAVASVACPACWWRHIFWCDGEVRYAKAVATTATGVGTPSLLRQLI